MTRRPRLALPFSILPDTDSVRLIAGEDVRYTLSGSGLQTWLPALLGQFDGRRTADELLRALLPDRRDAAAMLIDRLYGERIVVDGLAHEAHVPTRDVQVLWQDRLDYAAALRFNRESSSPWIWATYGPLSRGYVSPLFLHDAGPCLACLLAHFRRLSPAPEIHDSLTRGAPVQSVTIPEAALTILRSLVAWKQSLATTERPPAALYRLHVLEIATMEVSSHRVLPDPECREC